MNEKQIDLLRDDQEKRWRAQDKINSELFSKANAAKDMMHAMELKILERIHKIEKRVAIIVGGISFTVSLIFEITRWLL